MTVLASRNLRAPTVKRGDAITARVWNQMASAVNGSPAPPADLDQGVEAEEISADVVYPQVSRSNETVRVTNPEDEAQYVDVARATLIIHNEAGRLVGRTYEGPANG